MEVFLTGKKTREVQTAITETRTQKTTEKCYIR